MIDLVSVRSLAIESLDRARESEKRQVIGIAGPPGAGKSTLTAALVRECGKRVANSPVVGLPMDGFHYSNRTLAEMGREKYKGAPDTFDSKAFVAAVRRLALERSKTTKWPSYSHHVQEPLKDAITVQSSSRLLFVEGNYLLLAEPPWTELRRLLQPIWYVTASRQALVMRLVDRQMKAGRSRSEAMRHVERSDMPNAARVDRTRNLADRIIHLDTSDPLLRGLRDSSTGEEIILAAD